MADIDWKTIIYSKVEIDDMRGVESARVDGAVALKLDANELGAPSGTATLDDTGKLKQAEIPYATSVDGSNMLNAITVMTPQRVHEQIDAKNVWGLTTGDIVDQADLQAELDVKSDITHNHALLYEGVDPNIQLHLVNVANPHVVTKTQVGLGSVDNTTDLLKPISTDTQSALTLKSDVTHSHTVFSGLTTTKYVPQVGPTQVAGTVYYDSVQGTLAVQNGITGLTTYMGRNIYIRAYNGTGVAIGRGKAVKGAGPNGGLPSIVLAMADTFQDAQVIGLTVEDIPANSSGLLIRYGTIENVDTSSLTVGAPAYLSSTVAGGMTSMKPLIASKIGGIVLASVTGTILVDIHSNMVFPNTSAILEGKAPGTETLSLTETYQNITNYAAEDEVILGANIASGTLTPTSTMKHRVALQTSITFSSTTTTRVVYVDLYNTTTATTLTTTAFNIPRDATITSIHFSKLIAAVAGNSYVLRMRSVPNMGITFSDLSYDIASV